MMRGQDMEKSKRRNESVQQGRQDQPQATVPSDVPTQAGLGVNATPNTLLNQIKRELIMANRPEGKENKDTNNCQVDVETKEKLLDHLEVHGALSLLTSAKFGRYTGCVLEEIEGAIAAESALIATTAVDSTGSQDAAVSPADDTTESPAAVRVRLQTGRRMISYRQGRI